MLLRASRRGPGAQLRRPAGPRDPDRRLRLGVSLGDPGRLLRDRHGHGAAAPPHQRHELVPPRRAAVRGVRILVGGDPHVRALPDPLRHRLQHEHGPPLARGGDDLRAARRRRGANGLHPVPDLPRQAPPRARARGPDAARRGGRRLPPRGLGPGRALLRRALRVPEGPLQADACAAGHARRLHRLRRQGADRRRRLRLPPLLPARQRPPHPHPRGRGDAELDRPRGPQLRRAGRCRRRDGRVPRLPRRDPDGRPRADGRPARAAAGGGARRRLAGARAERGAPGARRARRQPDRSRRGRLRAGRAAQA